MRYLCFSLLLVFSFVGMLRGETTNEKPLPGYYTSYKVNSKGKIINFSYTYTGEKMIPEHPIESIVKNTPLYSDTAVLWVDRNHQNAIAENVAISNDGMSIFAGWWLNNERASLYRSIGNGVPLWAYSMPPLPLTFAITSRWSSSTWITRTTLPGSGLCTWIST